VNAFYFVRDVSSDRVWAAQVGCAVRLIAARSLDSDAFITKSITSDTFCLSAAFEVAESGVW
jgi:hypothetical protein